MRRREFIAALGSAAVGGAGTKRTASAADACTSIPEVGFLYPDTTEASKPCIAWTLYSLESLPFAMFRVSHRLR